MPSPFIDIMMLRPASRTSAISRLEVRLGGADHAVREAEIAHERLEPCELSKQRLILLSMEFDDQQALGLADHHAVNRVAEDRDAAAEVDHRAIDELHRFGIERDNMTRRLHRGAERRKLADAQPLCAA